MSRLQIAFGVCAIVIALGFLIRRLFLRGPDGPGKVTLVSALLLNVTMPATLIGAFLRVRRVEPEGLIMMALGISADTLLFVVASVIFRWFPGMGDLSWRPAALTCTSGLNISLFFYPVIESIAGMEGLSKVVWLDMLNIVFILTVIPLSFALAHKPPPQPASASPDTAPGNESSESTGVELSTMGGPSSRASGAEGGDGDAGVRVVSVVDLNSGEVVVDRPSWGDSCVDNRKSHKSRRGGSMIEAERSEGMLSSRAKISSQQGAPSPNTEDPRNSSGADAEPLEAEASRSECHQKETCKSIDDGDGQGEPVKSSQAETPDPEAPSMKELAKKISLKVGINPPLWAIPIGLALGLSGVNLPPFLLSLQTTLASANSALSFFIIGLLLDVRLDTIKRLYKPALMSMAVRYSIGLTLGFVLYYTLGTLSIFSPLGRFILLIGFVMPTTVVTCVYAKEWGWDPAFPSLMVNLTIVVSFVLIWILSTAVGLPESHSETSSSM
eukprot:m51a1_g5184 hypothetical protein (498) ;mRNA; r:179869-181362